MNEILNHLLQSTVFAAAVGAINTTLRRNSPRLRYWLWLGASLKFLVPFSWLVAIGATIQMPPDTPSFHAVTVRQISTAFAPVSVFPAPVAHTSFRWPLALAAVWAAGGLLLLFRWFRQWRTIHRAARRAALLPLQLPVAAFSTPSVLEPGVFGVFRPVLLLPEGFGDHLSPRQFDAVVTHELRHVRFRDNLTAALHMCVETLFWFHPLVWWIGAQLVAERERDCDEAVLMQGSRPGDYARGIVQMCQAYVASPLACASGISGSDLRKRIREIMTWRGSLPVTLRARVLLAAATFAAVSCPFAIGILRAQTLPPAPAYTYDAVSIHKSESTCPPCGLGVGPQGGLRIESMPVIRMLAFAYGVQLYQVLGGPGWVSSDNYDIVFTPGKAEAPAGPGATPNAAMARNRQRLQAVLRDRFGLILRTENHELPIYLLTQAKKGAKLTVHPEDDPQHYLRGTDGPAGQPAGHMDAVGVAIKALAGAVAGILGRPVTDETGLTGRYDFKLDWTPDFGSPDHPDDTTGPSIFTALTEQLGLRLESAKGPVPVYVIEKIQHPSEN